MIQKAKQQADCIIFVAHWGTEDETMPNEYEKQWAAYLMEQGVKCHQWRTSTCTPAIWPPY